MIRNKQWIVTADERKANLLSCEMIGNGHWHVTAQDAITNRWEDYHEHHRPNALGRGPTANAAQHFAATEHDPDEEHRRFARDVARWLTQSARDLSITRVDVFAAPRFLGVLREVIDQTKLQADLHQAELTRLNPTDLAVHPAILNALQSGVACR